MSWVGMFSVCAGWGFTLGCLTTLAPNIRPRGAHATIEQPGDDADCLVCHEPELAAQARLMALTAEERQHQLDHMMNDGGAALVAQWMIDEPRSCRSCHIMRGTKR